mgnify:CR=1 FL=1
MRDLLPFLRLYRQHWVLLSTGLLLSLFTLLAGIGLAGNQAHALGFAEALDLAEQHSPRITAQRLQIDAASSSQKSAGTLPDPKLSVGVENFPISGMDRFSLTRESMTMQRLALMQEVPNRAKRDAQIASAQAKVERERATLAVQRLQIRQRQVWRHRHSEIVEGIKTLPQQRQ